MNAQLITRLIPLLATATLLLTSTQLHAATATISPVMDNTMAQELPDNSSGACDSIFSGLTDNGAGTARRALIRFDIAGAIPAGSVINSVTLSMTVTRGGNHVPSTFTLHRVTTDWGEGANGCGPRGGGQGEPAVSGAATWNDAEFGITAWGTPGSDYVTTASGSTLVDTTAPSWSDAGMAADVQAWLDNPGANYGWVLIGDEATSTTTRRFDSREGASPPELVVEYTPTGDVEACCEDDGSCSLTLVGSGTCIGTTQTGVTTCDPNPCPQPSGACCNADNTCDDSIEKDVCESAGGTFVGGNCNQADCGLTPFVEPLPIPPVLAPTGTRADGVLQYTVSVEEATQSVHPGLPDTTVWTYNGSWPASTIVAQQGQPIEVTYQNNLPSGGGNRGSSLLEVDTCAHGPNNWGASKRIVTHLHGGHLPARFDGQPEYHILPGETDVYEYPNNQEAGTLWYHDHALGITRLNVYGGMAGFYLLADEEDTLGAGNKFDFPSGQYEIGLAIQDRSFNEDGSLFYNAQLEDAFKGDYAVVNGKISPYLFVDRGKYRFRMLNGSQSREYIYRLENTTDPGNDPSFILVGTDLGLVDEPIDLGNSTGTKIAPAERLDVVIDFAGYPAGTEIILRNDDPTPPLLPSIMKFIVTDQPGHTDPIASTLRPVPPLYEGSEDVTRYFRLKKEAGAACKDGSGRLVNEWLVESLDGPGGNVIGQYWDDLSEFPILGTREIWEFENPTNVMHPMHVHLVKFQILSKETLGGQPIPLEPWEENAWKDIVRIPANARARIIMDFEDYPGRFPQHCHILDHEDHEMMRQFQASFDPAGCNNDGTCDLGEDCTSCADCGQVSGAFCGNGLCEGGDGENCATCPADCGGKQNGSVQNQYCCGFNDGQVTNSIGCGVDASDDRCIDASNDLFCRNTPRLSACCGDLLCEGAEINDPSCTVDCVQHPDFDLDGIPDAIDSDDDNDGVPDTEDAFPLDPTESLDTDGDGIGNNADTDDDGDGLSDTEEDTAGSDPLLIDTDGDGLVDGSDGFVTVGDYPGGVDADEDGFVDGEQDYGTDPVLADTDGEGIDDGLEVANGSNPLDALSWPAFANGDVVPDGVINAADLLIAQRIALGDLAPTAVHLAYGDMNVDGKINAADIILIQKLIIGL